MSIMMVKPLWSASADPSFSSVKLLLGFNGTDASTTFVDESSAAHGMTAAGNGQLDTAQFKFGTASYLGDGSGDACFVSATNTDLDTASSSTPFTIECFVRFNSTAGNQAICGTYNSPNNGFLLQYNSGSGLFWLNIGFTTVNYAGFAPSTGTWYYIGSEFDGTNLRLYTDDGAGNAVMRTKNTNPQQLLQGTNIPWAVGFSAGGGVGINSFNGWIDEFRYTNGVARYATDTSYAVPIAAFPR